MEAAGRRISLFGDLRGRSVRHVSRSVFARPTMAIRRTCALKGLPVGGRSLYGGVAVCPDGSLRLFQTIRFIDDDGAAGAAGLEGYLN